MKKKARIKLRWGKLERYHLKAVTNQHYIAHHNGMVPGLSFDRLKPGKLCEFV